jgi:hypothetical protein
MNPALPLLALLTAAGALALRREGGWRELGLAWMLAGFAGLALLAPALALPEGIPSPAATLAQHAPWQLAGDPAAGNPLLRDVTYQIQPWLLYLRQELRAGRLPYWNSHQQSGAPFWANGQSAPLFPLHLLFVALPLQLGFVLLPWLRVTVAGCGVWLLARELGLGRPAAAVATLVYPLSGMFVSFLLFPMGNALALVPWVIWAVERIAAGTGGWGTLALCAGLQLLGGHPETSAFTALLGALYLLVRGFDRWAAWRSFAAGWLGAAAIAAVQILPLALYLPLTAKWQQAHDVTYPPLAVLGHQLLRLALPQLFGHPVAGTWWGPFNYSATAVYAGALALPLAAAGLAGTKDDRRLRAIAALLFFSLLAAYHLPGLRELLAALPVLGRAALHRLIFGVELGLALLAGAGCERWLAGRGRGLLAGAAAVCSLLALAWGLDRGAWASRGLVREQALWTAWALLVCLALALSLRLSRTRRWTVWPLLLAAGLADLLAAHGGINPGLALSRHRRGRVPARQAGAGGGARRGAAAQRRAGLRARRRARRRSAEAHRLRSRAVRRLRPTRPCLLPADRPLGPPGARPARRALGGGRPPRAAAGTRLAAGLRRSGGPGLRAAERPGAGALGRRRGLRAERPGAGERPRTLGGRLELPASGPAGGGGGLGAGLAGCV